MRRGIARRPGHGNGVRIVPGRSHSLMYGVLLTAAIAVLSALAPGNATRAASEAANMARIENELAEMRARLRALEAEERD